MRWAAIEACQRTRPGSKLAAGRARIITARGRNIGVVAAARRLLTLFYYGLRDGLLRPARRGDPHARRRRGAAGPGQGTTPKNGHTGSSQT